MTNMDGQIKRIGDFIDSLAENNLLKENGHLVLSRDMSLFGGDNSVCTNEQSEDCSSNNSKCTNDGCSNINCENRGDACKDAVNKRCTNYP